MKILVNGKEIILTNKDFLSQGGEGAVYVKNTTAYKIYTDKNKTLPENKIKELSVLTDKCIIKPEQMIYDEKGNKIGYTMRFVKNTTALCRAFTKAFKTSNNISPEMSFNLVKKMKETVSHIHSKNILIVDLNEMNFLLNEKFNDVYFIDVDSYQTKSYHATALMESVRDRHSAKNKFNEKTDWFAFAIVSFQLLIGIHPYKGNHSSLKGFDERMINNVSVFNKSVKIPNCCMPFDVIPSNWKDWYYNVFEKGERTSPPDSINNVVKQVRKNVVVNTTNGFIMNIYFTTKSEVVEYTFAFGIETICCKDGFYHNKTFYNKTTNGKIFYYNNNPYIASVENNKFSIFNVRQNKHLNMNDFNVTEIMTYQNRLYGKIDDKIVQFDLIDGKNEPCVGINIVGNVLENSTQLFEGVAIQNALGTFFASIFAESMKCYQIKLPLNNSCRVIDAKYFNGVLVVVYNEKGKYNRLILTSEKDFILNEDVQDTSINFTVNNKGICVLINDLEEVIIFNVKDLNKIKTINDPAIKSDCTLCTNEENIMFFRDNEIFTIKTK